MGTFEQTLITLLVGVFGAVVGAVTAYSTIYNSSVIEERKQWRDFIRVKSQMFVKSVDRSNQRKIREIINEFSMRLNPHDRDDQEIVECMKIALNSPNEFCCDEFFERISILLKHDWERAKLEASFFSRMIMKPIRQSFVRGVRYTGISGKKLSLTKCAWISVPLIVGVMLIIHFLYYSYLSFPMYWSTITNGVVEHFSRK